MRVTKTPAYRLCNAAECKCALASGLLCESEWSIGRSWSPDWGALDRSMNQREQRFTNLQLWRRKQKTGRYSRSSPAGERCCEISTGMEDANKMSYHSSSHNGNLPVEVITITANHTLPGLNAVLHVCNPCRFAPLSAPLSHHITLQWVGISAFGYYVGVEITANLKLCSRRARNHGGFLALLCRDIMSTFKCPRLTATGVVGAPNRAQIGAIVILNFQ